MTIHFKILWQKAAAANVRHLANQPAKLLVPLPIKNVKAQNN